MNKHNEVFVISDGEYKEVRIDNTSYEVKFLNDYINIIIPQEFLCTYHKLLTYFADFSEELLKTNNLCNSKHKTVIDCWNMFQSAIACLYLNQRKQADLFIDYINKQMVDKYKCLSKKLYTGDIYFPITDNGELEGLNTCNTNVDISLDLESGHLCINATDDLFSIEDNNLIVKK